VSEVHKITGADCGEPPPVYRAAVGIPGITGNWFPNMSGAITDNEPLARSQWLLCYEAFSLPRWILLGWDQPNFVFVLANDYWTEPVSVNFSRRKVSKQFARLFGVTPLFAENGKTVVELKDATE
jgi:hypothetical protein